MTQYKVPNVEWQDYPQGNEDNPLSRAYTLVHEYNLMQSNQTHKVIVLYYNKHTKQSEPYVSAPRFNSLQEAKEWVETTHYPSALIKAGFELVSQEALKPTVYRLDYYDGDYYWYLVHSYDRAELEKLIADATEYHKTIKDLDFDDDEAVDAWLEKHPLNDFNGDSINDLLEIDDYEPLSAYLSINSFEVSGVSE